MQKTRVVLVLFVALMLVGAQQLGLFQQLAAPASLKQNLVSLGYLGYLAFVVSYAMLQPFGVPGTVFIWAAPLIWPWPIAFALSMIGTLAASVIGFSFARFIGRDWLSPKIPERFKRYDEALVRRAFATVFTLRLIFWMPQALHVFFGVSRVPFSTHFWGSLAGYALPLFVVSFFGEQAAEVLYHVPASAWLAGGGVMLVFGAGWWWRAKKSKRLVSAETTAP